MINLFCLIVIGQFYLTLSTTVSPQTTTDYRVSNECFDQYMKGFKVCDNSVQNDWKNSTHSKELLDAMIKRDKVKEAQLKEVMRCFFLLTYVDCLDHYTQVSKWHY